MITLVVAHDLDGNIGKDGQLPWGRLPNDLKFFKEQTIGKNVLMGRKTFESIGKPLPDRNNYVITSGYRTLRNLHRYTRNLNFISSSENVLKLEKIFNIDWYVIGGETLYDQFMPFADRIIQTQVFAKFDGCNARFPNPFEYGHWKEKFLGEMPPDKENKYLVTFRELIREEKECQKPSTNLFI